MSEYRKTPRDQRDKYQYDTATGKIDITAQISIQWRETLHRMDDRIVDNNCKNGHPPMDERQKAEKKEWEEAHPGERYPANWNMSFEAHAYDPELDDDKQPIYSQILKNMQSNDDPLRDWLYEKIPELDEKEQLLFHLLIEEEMPVVEIMVIFGKSKSSIYRLIDKMTEDLVALKKRDGIH
ncbi:MAG: hypothetical protein SPL49_00615 [Oribacterium sp.]|nr:hypothetical protein [Oribacterium sp.]